MKFRIQKAELQDVLQTLIGVVPSRATFPVLHNFSFRLEGNILEVGATDLDQGIRKTVEVEGERDGGIIVNARRLVDLIKSLVDPSITTVSFDAQDYVVNVRWSERGYSTLTGFDITEFPPFPEVVEVSEVQMSASELAFLVEKTAFAVTTDPTRVIMSGVYMEAADNKVSMVGTDSHRLGLASIDMENVTLEQGVIIPPKVLRNFLHSVPADAVVEIRISQKYVLFSYDNIQMFSKLVDGKYVAYKNVIPQNFTHEIQVRTTELINKIRCVISMASLRTRKIRMQIQDSSLELTATDSESGGFSCEEMAIIHEGEGSFCIGFNGNFLVEILGMCKTEEVKIKMTSAKGACVVEPLGEDLNFSFLLMPLRDFADE